MKASELRIGNWINAYHNDVQVTAIDSNPENYLALQIHTTPNMVGATHGGMYYPIPLSEEWLIKFGFEKSTELVSGWFKGQPIERWSKGPFFIHNTDILNPTYGIGLHNIWDGLELNIKHVHQLQNLYFALTGEELALK